MVPGCENEIKLKLFEGRFQFQKNILFMEFSITARPSPTLCKKKTFFGHVILNMWFLTRDFWNAINNQSWSVDPPHTNNWSLHISGWFRSFYYFFINVGFFRFFIRFENSINWDLNNFHELLFSQWALQRFFRYLKDRLISF